MTLSSESPGVLLFVDDEPGILASLRRLFRPHGYTIHVAESGAAGLAVLESQPVDLVISDMRMPEMNGAQFLESVRARWPDVMRLLLTGYADVGSTIAAINRGEIYRYIAKPWDDQEILQTVQKALEHKRLGAENARLLALTQAQNAELETINATLEAKVAARTRDLRRALELLEGSNGKLKKSFLGIIKLLSGVLDLRSNLIGGHARRVAESARTLAQRLGEDDASVQDIFFAALLHDIGKIGWQEDLIDKPMNRLTADERNIVVRHPAIAQNLLMSIEPLRAATLLIRHHHEHFDGSGFPDQLGGLAIPMGARIIAVANDFDSLCIGTLVSRPLSVAEARVFLSDNRGKRYDPTIVEVFDAMIGERGIVVADERQVKVTHLHPGMVLARDVMHPEGYLLLLAGHSLDAHLIEQLLKIEKAVGRMLPVFVRNEPERRAGGQAPRES